ncbi:sister chromatid cohesion protein DCC1 isoform X2 [Ceratina calcarata]|uniref:Sister chromatid cohesion protein DCC1 n=1 Tax=Ceratina calcarata TaxID=156304 RepID=A0AAJ7IW24_9HYME|nr:sister chromatid cohesion protein DCC1 isoform X2 [Ceratina calcarata]
METTSTGYSPTIEDVRENLQLAAIKESDLQSVTQILFSERERDMHERVKLLELDENLLKTIEKGESLKFQGCKNDTVVLCTKNRTYDVKEVEISNSLMLTPNLELSEQTNVDTPDRTMKVLNISGIFHTYFEAKECEPRLEKLFTILEPTSYKGVEYESSIPEEDLYDWRRLQNEIQASEEELVQALNDYFIVNIDGYFRLISFEFKVRCVTLMLDLFEEFSWEIDEVDRELTYDHLKDFIPKPVFDTLFKKYTNTSDKSKEDGTRLHRYNEEQCCKTLAKVLLAASPVTEYKQFMESWNIGTPEKIKPKEEYLNGIALIKWNSLTMEKEVVSYAETDLPKDINERFNALFKEKDKWTVEEITPYITNLTSQKMNVNAALTKYARCSVINGVKHYSSKHGK